jgi:propanol-preferring alcohol dehydrogenase
MKAMVLTEAARPLTLQETAVPTPAPGQILIKVNVCGVCHTDLQTAEGELALPRLPLIPGHQVVGRVAAVGEGNGRYQPGDRVGVAWINGACGECDYCRRGLENLCPNARFTGLHVDGGYAEQMVVDERFAFRLPESFSDERAAPLLCGGIIGYRSLKLSGIRPGERLGLFGFGGSAHQAIQVARHWGCEAYVFTRSADHQRHARELGAVWTGSAHDKPPHLLDAAITFAPAGWIVPLALGCLRPGGTLAINAIHTTPIPEMPYALLYGERVVRSVANFTRQDAEEYLALAGEIDLQTAVERYPLAEANEVLARLKAREVQGTAVLVVG